MKMKIRFGEWFQCPFCPLETDVGYKVKVKIKDSEESERRLICRECFRKKKHLKTEVAKYEGPI